MNGRGTRRIDLHRIWCRSRSAPQQRPLCQIRQERGDGKGSRLPYKQERKLHKQGRQEAEDGGIAVAAVKFGTDGRDILVGTNGADQLFGKGGSDGLVGKAADDVLMGGDGKDYIFGGSVRYDEIFVGDSSQMVPDGRDKLYGDGGSDCMFGGSQNDVNYGGPGDDEWASTATSSS
jgi:Ca2+-binding RTX toxin-like protein